MGATHSSMSVEVSQVATPPGEWARAQEGHVGLLWFGTILKCHQDVDYMGR